MYLNWLLYWVEDYCDVMAVPASVIQLLEEYVLQEMDSNENTNALMVQPTKHVCMYTHIYI